jgi:hypothetical protein
MQREDGGAPRQKQRVSRTAREKLNRLVHLSLVDFEADANLPVPNLDARIGSRRDSCRCQRMHRSRTVENAYEARADRSYEQKNEASKHDEALTIFSV